MVPEVGLEPTHLAVLDFESSASTNSTTRAAPRTNNTDGTGQGPTSTPRAIMAPFFARHPHNGMPHSAKQTESISPQRAQDPNCFRYTLHYANKFAGSVAAILLNFICRGFVFQSTLNLCRSVCFGSRLTHPIVHSLRTTSHMLERAVTLSPFTFCLSGGSQDWAKGTTAVRLEGWK